MTDYKAIADGVIEKLFDFEKATDWIKSKETKEIKISYKQSQDFDGRMFKCEYVIDAPVEKVVDVIMDLEKHLKWDSSVKTITSVEKIDEEMGVFYTVTPSYLAGLISSRDTCDLIGVRHIPAKDIYVIYDVSVDHPACPPVKKYVRARNYPSGTLLYKVDGDPNKTRLIDMLQFELHLSPKSLIDRLMPSLIPTYASELSKGVKEL